MIRTQVYIPDDLYRDITLLAQKEKGSVSQLMRDGLRELLTRRKNRTKRTNPFIGVTGIYKKGKKMSGQEAIDDYYMNGVV